MLLTITAYTYYPDTGEFACPVSSCCNLPAEGLLNWLTFSSSTLTSSSLKVAWNLTEFTKAILSRLPDTITFELSRPPHRSQFGNYKLFYIPDKVFSVNKNGSEASFYDLSQYYPGEPEPEILTALQDKADRLQQSLSELGITRPQSLSSPVACFKGHKSLEAIKDTAPTIFDATSTLLSAHEAAFACTPREWISNYQVGHFSKLWKFDISSAYAWQASLLPDLRDCVVQEADKLDSMADCASLVADYGFLVGDFTVYPSHPLAFCSPFLANRGDGVLVNFVGTKHDYPCSLDEVKCLYRYGMGEFHFKSGWVLYPDKTANRPFAQVMNELYNLRDGSEPRSYILKRVMNGIIGRMLEVRKDDRGNVLEYGWNFNPIYHSIITTRTRLQVFDFIAEHGITKVELVHVGVDGIRATKHIHLPDHAPMGGWRCAGSEPAVVLSPGAIISPDRNFKKTGYADLMVDCLSRPRAYKLGNDKADPIDLSRLFLNQTRSFPRLLGRARGLLGVPCLSDPVEF